jgi:hypothetical protein
VAAGRSYANRTHFIGTVGEWHWTVCLSFVFSLCYSDFSSCVLKLTLFTVVLITDFVITVAHLTFKELCQFFFNLTLEVSTVDNVPSVGTMFELHSLHEF